MSDSALLQLEHVAFSYGGADAPPVFSDVNLQVGRGESVAVVGPSGCGKSTLLNLIGTLERPTGGSITLQGTNLASLDANALARLRNEKIGFIFQDHHLLPQCTLLENVLLPTLAGHRKCEPDMLLRGRKLLERIGLGERMHHRPGEVSGGQRQRAAVVRALINQPVLLLADEPTGSLDRHSAESLADLLVEINDEQQMAMIIVTHSMDLARRTKSLLELADGRLQPLQHAVEN